MRRTVAAWPLLAGVLAGSASGLLPDPAVARPLTVHDLLGLAEPGPFAQTPDGRFALMAYLAPYVAARNFSDETQIEAQRARLRVVSLTNGRARTLRVQPGPLDPEGRRLAVFGRRNGRLHPGVLDLDTGRIRLLDAETGPFGLARRVAWTKGGLIALVTDEARASDAALSARLQALWSRQRAGRTTSATEITTERTPLRRLRLVFWPFKGRPQILVRGPIEDFEPAPDGPWTALLVSGAPKPLASTPTLQVADRFHLTGLQLFNRTTREIRPGCPGLDILPTLLAWSPDGQRLAVVARASSDPDWSRAQVRVVEPRSGSCTLWSSSPGTLVRRVASDAIPVAAVGWAGERPAVAVWSASGAPPSWRRLAPTGEAQASAPPPLAAPPLFPESFRPDAPRAALGDGPGEPGSSSPALRLARASDGSIAIVRQTPGGSQVLLALNRTPLRALSASAPEALEGAPGTPPHWLYPPARLPRGGRAPLVVLPYPGSSYATPPGRYAAGSASLITQAQLLAAHGYAVLVPSLPASRDARWPDRPWPSMILPPLRDAIAAARSRPFVDPSRVAIWGHSFGGLAALLAAERLEGLAAVVAQNAPTDLISLRGSLPLRAVAFSDPEPSMQLLAGWAEGGQGGLEATPWEAPLRYQAASPLFAAARTACPVLLMTGDRDFVSFAQAQEMLSALRRLDKPAELLTFWGEGHVLLSPANIQTSYDAAFAFLDRAFSADAPPSTDASKPPGPQGP